MIATRNGATTIGAQLDALEAQDAAAGCEVIVSDNGSIDDTAEIARGYSARHPWIKLVDSSDRPGVAHARNVGVDAASAASIAFCDQDDVVGAGWLAAMVSALEQHEFVAGRLKRPPEPGVGRRGAGRPQAEGLLWYMEGGQLPFAFGCSLGVRKEIHHTAGGFDERFVKGAEDIHYCWRLQLLGHRLVFIPDAVTHYRFRRSGDCFDRRAPTARAKSSFTRSIGPLDFPGSADRGSKRYGSGLAPSARHSARGIGLGERLGHGRGASASAASPLRSPSACPSRKTRLTISA